MMILLDIFQVYLPIILGCRYLYKQDKDRIEQLLKFEIIHCLLWLIQQLLCLLIQPVVLQYLLVLPYLNLTIYHYIYASDLYDLMVAPMVQTVRDYVVLKAHKWSYKSKLLLDPDNLFLVKQTKEP